MRTFVITALLLVCAISAYATSDIACNPEVCMHVKCGLTAECLNLKIDEAHPRYRIIRRGGFCGCCDLCQTLLREHESCPRNPIRGMAQSSVCADGLKCDHEKLLCVKA